LEPREGTHIPWLCIWCIRNMHQALKEGYAERFCQPRRWCPEHLHYHGKPAKKIPIAAAIPTKKIAVKKAMVTSTYMEAKNLKARIDCDTCPLQTSPCTGVFMLRLTLRAGRPRLCSDECMKAQTFEQRAI
jgi:hypothetical protein